VGRRSEEGLIENTWWVQCARLGCYHSDVLSGVILKQIIYTDNSVAGRGRESSGDDKVRNSFEWRTA